MILINGYFFCRRLTGIERYAIEITNRLEKLCLPGEIFIIIPGGFEPVPDYKNIHVIRHKKVVPNFIWQFFVLQSFLLRHRQYTVLDFSNTCLPFFPGIVFLHDIYCEFFPEDFTSLRDKLGRLYNRWQYRLIAKKAKRTVTVSCFTKNQFSERFGVKPDAIQVIYSSWEHFKSIRPDFSIFNEYPCLEKDRYFFSLGSLSKRKNIRWIIEYARKHPASLFALSGTSLPGLKADGLNGPCPENIILLGYLDDAKVRALLENCKAFILPSYYEGFGLTPLEALSCGAKIIVSNAASLPEIYGKTAHYIDPFNTGVDLEKLLEEPVEAPDRLLKLYSYDEAAKKVYALIREYERNPR